MNSTIRFYNTNAKKYIESTIDCNMSFQYEKFMKYLKPGDKILDLGCGSGRDTSYFLSEGFEVDAIDGSKALCEFASIYTGVEVQCIKFSEIAMTECYKGIWACASLLHLKSSEIRQIFTKLKKSLVINGIFYASFKYNENQRSVYRGKRFYTDFNEDSLPTILKSIQGLKLVEQYITSDVRHGRINDRWINAIIKRVE